jgi:hypothetical protein
MKDRNIQGIGGWLTAVAAFQVIYVLQHLRHALALLMRERVWTPYTAGELAGHLFLTLLVLYCTVLLFRRRRTFPGMFLVQIWLIACFHVLGIVLVATKLRVPHGMSIEVGLVIFNVMLAVVGTFYIRRSVRVHNTFAT